MPAFPRRYTGSTLVPPLYCPGTVDATLPCPESGHWCQRPCCSPACNINSSNAAAGKPEGGHLHWNQARGWQLRRSATCIETGPADLSQAVRRDMAGIQSVASALSRWSISMPLRTELIRFEGLDYRHGAPSGAWPSVFHREQRRTQKERKMDVDSPRAVRV